jgi:hypothetical protein
MMRFIYRYEKEIAYIFTILLILFNLVCLYFIIDLMGYDEIVGYLIEGDFKYVNLHYFIYVFLIGILLNMLFVFAVLCVWFIK